MSASVLSPLANPRPSHPGKWHPFIPKSIVCLREGYGRQFFFNDLFAGLTVGVIALPLAMAFAIGSGVAPEKGLYTAIIAGFIIACLGGSRVSVAGPTGAFMPILFAIIAKQGYQGLAIATIMAGVILIIMGLAKLGSLIKYIPYPVTTGFTTGIAVIIFSQQIKDIFGLHIAVVPPEFIEKWYFYIVNFHTINLVSTAIGVGSVILLMVLRKAAPRVPAAIIIVVLAAVLAAVLNLNGRYGVETIQSRFGGIPQSLPTPQFHAIVGNSFPELLAKMRSLIPEATTIAMLAAIESLLCCVVADGMIGGRHKSNCELVAQGVGNIASIFFGGIPATGAIARTAANVKAGGRTPLSSMIHGVFVLAAMLVFAKYAGEIPLAALAAILVVVAWNMSELDHFRTMMRAPRSDIIVLLTTFGLTVLVDLTYAVGVGMVLAALLFMKRMSEVTNVGTIRDDMDESDPNEFPDLTDPNSLVRRDVPKGVEVYEINGPFFFGVADRLKDTLREVEPAPKVFILRMRRVPAVDASGLHALEEFYLKCKRQGTHLLLAGVHSQPVFAMTKYGLTDRMGEDNLLGNIDDALNKAREILHLAQQPKPAATLPEVARERQ